MHPILFKAGPVTIYSYGFMLALAILIGTALAKSKAKKALIEPRVIYDLVFYIVVSGVIGARLFFILLNIDDYLINPLEIFKLTHGGLVIYGGLLGGVIGGILFLKIKKQPILKVLDLIAPYVALAQAIGRIGCFLNGCCYGKPIQGFFIKSHPTQIYESVLMLAAFFILRAAYERPHKTGGVFFQYMLLYSVFRFGVEFFRADNAQFLMGLTFSQCVSVLILAAALVFRRVSLKK